MKQSGILHGGLSKWIAEIGHGQSIVISDYGLPIPNGVPFIDFAIGKNLPSFLDVLDAVLTELVVERALVATELQTVNPFLLTEIRKRIDGETGHTSHEELKEQTEKSSVIIRTGEWTPYANVILFAGVVF